MHHNPDYSSGWADLPNLITVRPSSIQTAMQLQANKSPKRVYNEPAAAELGTRTVQTPSWSKGIRDTMRPVGSKTALTPVLADRTSHTRFSTLRMPAIARC